MLPMLIERTHYYAKPGHAAAVLRTRRRASQVRATLGLPPGAILVKADPEVDGPDVAWECRFPTPEAHQQDLAARDASAEFAAIRREMTTHLLRFERQLFRSDPDGAVLVGAGGSREARPIVPTEVTFASGPPALTGYLYLPPGPGPFPCVITNHGSGIHQGTTDVCRPAMGAVLMSWGYASFLPHRRGYGRSGGPPWRSEVSAEFGTAEYDRQLASRLTRESDDVIAALDYLAARDDIAAGRIGVLGSSFGGTVSLLAASRCERFRCAVDFAGAAMNWERTPVLRETMLAAAGQLTVPICLIQAENDYSTAPTREIAAELSRLGKVHQARVYPAFGLTPDEGHLFAGNGAMVWGAEVRGFLDRWL